MKVRDAERALARMDPTGDLMFKTEDGRYSEIVEIRGGPVPGSNHYLVVMEGKYVVSVLGVTKPAEEQHGSQA